MDGDPKYFRRLRRELMRSPVDTIGRHDLVHLYRLAVASLEVNEVLASQLAGEPCDVPVECIELLQLYLEPLAVV